MLSSLNLHKLRILLQKVRHLAGLDDTQVFVVSYPKSGRTWLRTQLGRVLCSHYGIDEALLLDTYNLTRRADVLRTRFIHDGSELTKGTDYHKMETGRARFRDRKVIFLIRDPRDVLVSCYFQASKRINVFERTISEFIRSDAYGIKKYVTFLNIWAANQNVPRDFLLLTYEDMHNQTAELLRRSLDFIGAEAVSQRVIDDAVAFASFENMRRMEKQDEFRIDWMRPGDVNDPESYKVRRGKVGGYTDYLSEADIAYIDATIAEMGCPFLSSYYE